MIDDLIPKQELLISLKMSDSTFKRIRKNCEASPYHKAIVKVGRKIYIHKKQWSRFMDYQSEKERKEKYGI